MLLFIGICYLIYQALKAWNDDFDCRQDAINRGSDIYSSRTGLRDVKTNKHCYIDVRTGKKILW